MKKSARHLTPPAGATMDLTDTAWIHHWREHLCAIEDAYDTDAERIEALAIVEYDAQVATEAEECNS